MKKIAGWAAIDTSSCAVWGCGATPEDAIAAARLAETLPGRVDSRARNQKLIAVPVAPLAWALCARYQWSPAMKIDADGIRYQDIGVGEADPVD